MKDIKIFNFLCNVNYIKYSHSDWNVYVCKSLKRQKKKIVTNYMYKMYIYLISMTSVVNLTFHQYMGKCAI